jgi:TetR/AcrR family transcriptional regulator, mexJK operon transcriptional repressor
MNSTVQFSLPYSDVMPNRDAGPVTPRVPSGERAERKRAAIMRSARETFLREGFDASVDDIAAHAGVSKVTVYNHFGNKETLFNAVVAEALDQALSGTLAEAQSHLDATTDDIRATLIVTAQCWVRGVTDASVIALRNLVSGQLHRFPELGTAWRELGPARFFPLLATVLDRLTERGQLAIPDMEVAVIQLYGLTLYPHLVYNSYGATLDEGLTDRLITTGVDMFLTYYHPPGPAVSAGASPSNPSQR